MASYSRCSRSAGSHGSAAGRASFSWPAGRRTARSGRPRRRHARAAPWRAAYRPPHARAARFGSIASNAPAAARLSSTRLLTARGLMRRAKSARSANGRLAARGDDRFDRLLADALERRQRIMDGVALDLEGHAGAVDRRRLDLDRQPLGLGAEFGELVGVAHVERHRGGEEFDRIIRLHDRRSGRRPARRPRRGSC